MARHKCIVCFGQSNMEGQAFVSELPAGTLGRWIGTNVTVVDTNYRISGINYWMADLDASSTIAAYTGKFTPAQFFYSNQGSWTGRGYEYSSTMTTPQAAPVNYSTQKVGPDVEIAWQMQHELQNGEDLYVIKLAIGSTYLSKLLSVTGAAGVRWWHYDDKNGDTGTATATFGAGRLDDNTKNWIVNVFSAGVQQSVTITAGLGAGQTRTITSNTANSLTITPNWTTPPDATSVYTIVPLVGHNDWCPSSAADYGLAPYTAGNYNYDLFGILTEIIFPQAQAWIHTNKGANDNLDVIGVFMKLGESDSLDATRAALAYQNAKDIRDTLRAKIFALGMTSRKAANIPFIISGHDTKNWTFANIVNAAFQQLADDDLWTGFFDPTGLPTNTGDPAHINATGIITLGQSFYTTWKAVVAREVAATRPVENLPTLLSLRTRVKQRYERNTAGNEAGDALINGFINDSIREMNNTLGDDTWFKRRIDTINVNGTYPTAVTLPKSVRRLLRIESQNQPGRAVVWKGLGYTDNGRLQITMHDYTGGPYVLHHIIVPDDLSADSDTTIIPVDYQELVVMLTCKRLAESVGPQTLVGYYSAEIDRLWKYVKRDCMRYDRMRQESLSVTDTWDTWRNAGFPDPLWYL